jgi:hypothetical protein
VADTEKIGRGATECRAGALLAGFANGSTAIGIGRTAADLIGGPGSGCSVEIDDDFVDGVHTAGMGSVDVVVNFVVRFAE